MIGYVIGDADMLTGFRLVGVEGTEANTVNEAKQALNQILSRSDIAIIIISEDFTTESSIRAQIDKIRQERLTPIIVELPGSKSPANGIKLSDTISKILGTKM
ncbi:MAG: V-type ATP synthase subunit F [Nitrososphaerota archaeon]|jgi:vacuolar-type H+-ATPase subunit F/Vma7|nr:V-type ATP synthase subunit F [Nitrososphaerota archaeon]